MNRWEVLVAAGMGALFVGAVVIIVVLSLRNGSSGNGAGENAGTAAAATLASRQQEHEEALATNEARATAAAESPDRGTDTPPPSDTPGPTRTVESLPYELALVSASCVRLGEGGDVECEGVVKNISDRTIADVSAVVVLRAKDDSPITSETAPIDSNPLPPGGESPFSLTARSGPAFAKWSVEFQLPSGETILTRDDSR